MLRCIGKIEFEKLREKLDTCIAGSIQIDGSVSKRMGDNKFVSCRIMTNEHELITLFLGVHEPDALGADGLMESFLAVKDNVKFPLSKLYGITTDSEGANTGKEAGLWKAFRLSGEKYFYGLVRGTSVRLGGRRRHEKCRRVNHMEE